MTEPAHDQAAEKAVLGSMLLSRTAIDEATETVSGADFYEPRHQTIHDAVLALYGAGKAVDAVTVADELTKRGELARVGGAVYLHALTETVPTVASAGYYAVIVRDLARRRGIHAASVRSAQISGSGVDDVDEVADQVEREIFAATQHRAASRCIVAAELLPSVLDAIEAIANNKNGTAGVPTGFADLDQLTNGLMPGQLVVVAARPGLGKSTLGVDFARKAARDGHSVALFSLEMSRDEILTRALVAESKVALHHVRSGTVDDDDWNRLRRRSPEVLNWKLYIDDTPGLTIPVIRSTARRIAARHGLDLILVDYLQLMMSGKRTENRQVEVADFSRSLKALAMELQVPVVALSQLNRGPEQRNDKKPNLGDLRESGAIEQDADIVILIHREDAYERESPRAGEADLIVAKHRNGPTAVVTVAFQGHYSRFVDMAQG